MAGIPSRARPLECGVRVPLSLSSFLGCWLQGGAKLLPPLVRQFWRPPQKGILHYEGLDHFSTKAGKKTPLAVPWMSRSILVAYLGILPIFSQ